MSWKQEHLAQKSEESLMIEPGDFYDIGDRSYPFPVEEYLGLGWGVRAYSNTPVQE